MSTRQVGDDAYESPMKAWDQRASVRNPRPDKERDGPQLPFSPALFPIVLHPDVAALGQQTGLHLLGRRCLAYLDFTENLELRQVAPAALNLATGAIDLGFDAELREDAMKIISDEGFHALEARRLKVQIVNRAGLGASAVEVPAPACLRKFEQHVANCQRPDQLPLIFTCVSETLITAFLTVLPEDRDVLTALRQKVREHAVDEAAHHRFFAQVMGRLWRHWSQAERDFYAPYFASFMADFLAPDTDQAHAWLIEVGFTEAKARDIVEETYTASSVAETTQRGAAASIRTMRNIGMLDHAGLSDALSGKDLH